MTLRLSIENLDRLPDGGPLRIEVKGRGLDLGRDAHLDWTLPDPSRTVSSKHCEIRFRDGGYWLHDISTNGTFVNGSPYRLDAPYLLRDRDRLSVGPNRLLAGTIANLHGRSAFLVLVDNDGVAYRLDVKPEPGGDAAKFSIPLAPDAGSAKQLQVILAIASTKPIPALETFRSGPPKAIAPALLDEAKSGSVAVGAEFFTFVN